MLCLFDLSYTNTNVLKVCPVAILQAGKSALDLATQEEIRDLLRAYSKLPASVVYTIPYHTIPYHTIPAITYTCLYFSLPVSLPPGARPGATIRNRDELCHAVKKEDVDEVRILLAVAAPDLLDVNVRDEVKYCTLLHFAVSLLVY